MSDLNNDLLNSEGIGGSAGTAIPEADPTVPPAKLGTGNNVNNLWNFTPVDPIEQPPDDLIESTINRPTYISHADWFKLDGRQNKPGLYWHGERTNNDGDKIPIDEWISSPISIDGITYTMEGSSYGRLLRFIDSNGKWHEWAMPMYLLKGSGEELRGELLDQGLVFNLKKRSMLLVMGHDYCSTRGRFGP